MISRQTPAVTPHDVQLMLKAGGPTLVRAMRDVLTLPQEIVTEILSEWEQNFIRDVATKAKEFRDNLTPKQAAKAHQILEKQLALMALADFYSNSAEKENERFSEPAKAPIAEVPKSNPRLDPEWGIF